MRVWLFCICRDEIQILPYFLRHYTPWVEKLIFYDDQSVDGTRELIRACPQAELRDWPGTHGIVDDEFLHFSHEVWKEARGKAEWVVFVDCDEFLYHPQIVPLLQTYLEQGITVPQVQGFTMFSREFPSTTDQIYSVVRAGVPDGCWDKKCIFRENIAWNVGRHSINFDLFNPRSSPTAELKLLHYRGLGMPYVEWRHRRNWERVPDAQRRMHLGENTNPAYTGHHGIEWYREVMSRNLPHVI